MSKPRACGTSDLRLPLIYLFGCEYEVLESISILDVVWKKKRRAPALKFNNILEKKTLNCSILEGMMCSRRLLPQERCKAQTPVVRR